MAPPPFSFKRQWRPTSSYGAGWQVPGVEVPWPSVLHTKFVQQNGARSSKLMSSPPHGAPLDPQHVRSLLPAFKGTLQTRFVFSGQHWALSVQGASAAKQFSFLLHCFLHRLRAALEFFFLHLDLHDFASASSVPSTDAAPSPATVAAKADLSRPRREPSSPKRRTNRSNAEPSMASFRSRRHTSAARVDVAPVGLDFNSRRPRMWRREVGL
jgi:hypothetical protein